MKGTLRFARKRSKAPHNPMTRKTRESDQQMRRTGQRFGGHCCPRLDTEEERDTHAVSKRSREILEELRGKEDDLSGGLI
ncbi:unnamed protein product [Rangifer tarandus platyrhynchus]|uniref:Uncharacterized protein n=1 Tax=Rangifer tarandus platyrhynchus TaxID=3082113 RepID=A0AC59ZZ41_RANTA